VVKDNYASCSIDDYVSDAALIWTKDIRRPLSDMWYIVVSHAANLGEALRREEYADAGHEVGRIAVWLVSFVARLHAPEKESFDHIFQTSTPLSRIIWNKYPNCCPVCYSEQIVIPKLRGEEVEDFGGKLTACNCVLRQEDIETRSLRYKPKVREQIRLQRRQYAEKHQPKSPESFSFDSLESMFFEVFQAAITVESPEQIGLHLLEEVGEVCTALTAIYTYKSEEEATPELYRARILELENEIADVISWLFAVSSKLRLIYEKFDRTPQRLYPDSKVLWKPVASDLFVSKRIWAEYGNTGIFSCRVCKQIVCNCSIHLVTKQEQMNRILGV